MAYKVESDTPEKIKILASHGLNKKKIAAGLGVAPNTLQNWLKQGEKSDSEQIYKDMVNAYHQGVEHYLQWQFDSILGKKNGQKTATADKVSGAF